MKVPVLAIASTALLAGLAYRAIKGPSAAQDKDGGKKAPVRKPSGQASAGARAVKSAGSAAEELTKDAATRIHKEFVKYKKASGAKMRSYDKMLGDLKHKLSEAEAEVKDKYKDVLADAEKRSKELKKSMMSFKVEGKEQWTGFKRDFTKDLESLGKDLKGIALS
ncbi:MAG: hypothetical protein M0D57_06535 [Sphingobacteriales bacterium JAD_PAG50586_3]|nr:MAG: hypothetical protein M0D57_06535 [Sphingobacteriales bacterium JAD_PAG50586_3]